MGFWVVSFISQKIKIELSIPHGFCQDPKDLYQNILKQYLVQSVQQMLTIFHYIPILHIPPSMQNM